LLDTGGLTDKWSEVKRHLEAEESIAQPHVRLGLGAFSRSLPTLPIASSMLARDRESGSSTQTLAATRIVVTVPELFRCDVHRSVRSRAALVRVQAGGANREIGATPRLGTAVIRRRSAFRALQGNSTWTTRLWRVGLGLRRGAFNVATRGRLRSQAGFL